MSAPTMTLRAKIFSGFALITLISLVVGGFALFRMKAAALRAAFQADKCVPAAVLTASASDPLRRAMMNARKFSLSDNYVAYDAALKDFDELNGIVSQMKAALAAMNTDAAENNSIQELETALGSFEESVKKPSY